MNKSKAQGTAFESALVSVAQDCGLRSGRLPEGGLRDVGDVWINDVPGRGHVDIPIVAWKRLVDTGNGRRSPDGERSVVVMATTDFLQLAIYAADRDIAFVVECKATERLNVTRELYDAKAKLRRWKER